MNDSQIQTARQTVYRTIFACIWKGYQKSSGTTSLKGFCGGKGKHICVYFVFSSFFPSFLNLLILERGRGRKRKSNIKLLFHLFIHSLVVSCMYPDWRLNLQLWHIGMTLSPNELPAPGCLSQLSSNLSIYMTRTLL